MTGCLDCGFVWNAAFDPQLLTYDSTYENDQTCSSTFATHVSDLTSDVRRTISSIVDPCVVEIGCGQGAFLEGISEGQTFENGGFFGYDPAWRGENGSGPGSTKIYREYYSSSTAGRMPNSPDIVISRHTIEHIANPRLFLREIIEAGKKAPKYTFFETPCANWIISSGQVQDFFYEHCSIFTANSLAYALSDAGFGSARVSHVFNGQYLWGEAGVSCDFEKPEVVIPDFPSWTKRYSSYLELWTNALSGSDRRVFLWGAGSKGVIFALLMEACGVKIDGVVDINPKKQNCYLPMTGIAVNSPGKFPLNNSTIVVMNPAYKSEIEQMLRNARIEADVLSM